MHVKSRWEVTVITETRTPLASYQLQSLERWSITINQHFVKLVINYLITCLLAHFHWTKLNLPDNFLATLKVTAVILTQNNFALALNLFSRWLDVFVLHVCVHLQTTKDQTLQACCLSEDVWHLSVHRFLMFMPLKRLSIFPSLSSILASPSNTFYFHNWWAQHNFMSNQRDYYSDCIRLVISS